MALQLHLKCQCLINVCFGRCEGRLAPDDGDEDELADIENNNPPGHAELLVDDQVDNSTA